MTLNARAWLALALLASVMCALIFGTAGTMRFWQAWVYVSIFVGASLLTILYLMKKDPALLARRMRGGPTFEREGISRLVRSMTKAFPNVLSMNAMRRLSGGDIGALTEAREQLARKAKLMMGRSTRRTSSTLAGSTSCNGTGRCPPCGFRRAHGLQGLHEAGCC